MGTISDKLMRIINTKEDIRQALISKGYDVPTSIPFKEYAKMISDLPCRVDSFPDIEGIVARYSAKDLTNEQMAANPVWVDKTGNGHDLQLKNFAWGGMSGVGGYSDNFSSDSWKKPSDRSDITWTSSSFNITRVMNTGVQIYYFSAWEESKSVIPEKRIIVKGLEDGQVLRYMNVGNRIIEISQDGIYTIPSFAFKGANSYHGYSLAKKQESCNVTVEQLPLYPGFILGDGVDDFAVTEKELNFEDTYTVYTAFIPFQDDPARNMILCGKNDTKDFSINYSGTHLNFKPSTGVNLAVRIDQFALLVCKRNKDITTIINLSKGESRSLKSVEFISNPGLYYLWRNVHATFFARAAIAGQTICNGHFSTDEEDEKVLNYYKQEYPWLFPDQAWTVVGKTNEDEDRATIANITGNGNDLVLSNFAFSGNSGYGSYVYNFNDISTWIYYSYNGTTEITSSTIHVTEAKTARPFLEKNTSSGGYNKMKIKVTGIKDGEILKFMSDEDRDNTINIEKDGIYSLPGSDKLYYGFRLSNSTNTYPFNCDITIEQIPEYEGYLVTDGVDDKVVSAESIAFTDTWTIITDTVFLGKVSVASGILASNIFTVYNYQGSGTIAVAMGDGGSSLRVITSSIKAFSSDGTIYDAEWNEYHVEIGTIRALERLLKIGTSSNETSYFCQLAFKFLGIYNNQILSKEDCIKAYNYLQTLK